MIESGGTTVIGASITACLTTFQQAVKGSNLIGDGFKSVAFIARFTMFQSNHFSSNSETVIHEMARLLDCVSNKKFWRAIPASQMVIIAQKVTHFSSYLSHLAILPSTRWDGGFRELCFYHAALLCRYLPRESRIVLMKFFVNQVLDIWEQLPGTITGQPIKSRKTYDTVGTYADITAIVTTCRFANLTSDGEDDSVLVASAMSQLAHQLLEEADLS
jgi:hypothetical protein